MIVIYNRFVLISYQSLAMIKLPKSKVRAVGVSNFTIEHVSAGSRWLVSFDA